MHVVGENETRSTPSVGGLLALSVADDRREGESVGSCQSTSVRI